MSYVFNLFDDMKKESSKTNCIFCKNIQVSYYFTKRNEHGEFPVFRCDSCKSAFIWPRPDHSEMRDFYINASNSNPSYEESVSSDLNYYPNSIIDAKRIIAVCKRLSGGGYFLDVGAGYGRFSKTAFDEGFRVSACEPNPKAREVFHQINGFEPDPYFFDEQYVKDNAERFDVVLLSQVLEHIVNPQETVRLINKVLKIAGIAAIAVPHFGSALSRIQGKRDMFISPPGHLNFFSKNGLVALFSKNGFQLEFLETVSKVNKGRIEKLIRFTLLSHMAWMSLYGILKFFELFNMGMVLNAYFRKIEVVK
jgi:SAM-dependent methyltransferase